MNLTYVIPKEIDASRSEVSARTERGNTIKIVIPTEMVGAPDMYAMLRIEAERVDKLDQALEARSGRADSWLD